MAVLRSVVFYTGMALATLVFAPMGLLLWPLPLHRRFPVMSRWAAFVLWWLRITCGLGFEVSGRENIPGTAGIIMCKHQSAFETLALQLLFPAQVWVLKRELLWIPIYGWGLASMTPIAIDRSSATSALRTIVREGCRRLEQGLWVVVFPEGTRTAPGQKTRYLPGGGMLAEKSGRPVVPVAHNSGWFWPRKSLRKRPGTVRMVIGPPIDPAGKSAAQITAAAQAWIEQTVAELPRPD